MTLYNRIELIYSMGQFSLYNTIRIERERGIPVYLQIVNALIKEVQLGKLRPRIKMMGIKSLATLLPRVL